MFFKRDFKNILVQESYEVCTRKSRRHKILDVSQIISQNTFVLFADDVTHAKRNLLMCSTHCSSAFQPIWTEVSGILIIEINFNIRLKYTTMITLHVFNQSSRIETILTFFISNYTSMKIL